MSNLKLIIKDGLPGPMIELITYPDGQRNIKLDMEYYDDPKMPVSIVCSIRNFSELEILLASVAALRKSDYFIDSIRFNYLFGMRSDRAFDIGMPNYFRDVVAPIINSLNIPEVIVMAPHSRLALNQINNSFYKFDRAQCNYMGISNHNYFKIGGDQSTLAMDCDVSFAFHKIRSPAGVNIKLDKTTREMIDRCVKPILIVDDLCDGGATFIEAAKCIREIVPAIYLSLFVYHGIFSKGVDHVAEHFEKIYTTNSVQEFKPHPKLTVIDVFS